MCCAVLGTQCLCQGAAAEPAEQGGGDVDGGATGGTGQGAGGRRLVSISSLFEIVWSAMC